MPAVFDRSFDLPESLLLSELSLFAVAVCCRCKGT